MTQKSVEELVRDIAQLREQLANTEKRVRDDLGQQLTVANEKARAAVAVISLAKKYGVSCDSSKKSAAYYDKILDAIVVAATKELTEQIVELKDQLDSATQLAEQELEARTMYRAQAEEFSVAAARLSELEPKLAEKIALIEKLEQQVKADEKVRAHIAAQAKSYKVAYEEARNRIVDLQLRIKALEDDNVALADQNDHLRIMTTSNIYAEIEAMIANVFIKHGYKVSPHAMTGDNTKENDRQFELFWAVQKALKLDRKAEKAAKRVKRDKGETARVVYPENGYKMILAELVKNYSTIIESHKETHPDVVEDFIAQHATQEALQDGQVTDQEMLEIILDKEQSQGGFIGFLKSTGGKVVSMVAGVVLVALIALSTTFGIGKADAELKLGEAETTISENQAALDAKDEELIEKDEIIIDTQDKLDEKQEELDKVQEEIEEIKGSYMSGDMVTVEVSTEDFNKYKSLLKPSRGGVARSVESCRYNKETGKVELLINCIGSDRKEAVDYVTFTIGMDNIAQAIKDGISVLDFSTIMDEMQHSNAVSRTTYKDLESNAELGGNVTVGSEKADETVEVSYSFDVAKKGNGTTVTCRLMAVKYDAQGKVIDVTTYDKAKTILATASVEAAKEDLMNDLLEQLDVNYEVSYENEI